MYSYISTVLVASSAILSVGAAPAPAPNTRRSQSTSITPHDSYSSSIGVLGCMIDTNRVAYWPSSVGCNNICVKVTHPDSGRSVHLLKVDQSGGAHDVSYDAWNYLGFGAGAADDPHMGGGIAVEYEDVPASECASLLKGAGGKLPLSASNSMNFVSSCLSEPDSFVAKNYALYNIMDPLCKWGIDETCDLDLNTSNQPKCPSGLGATQELKGHNVDNIEYGSGNVVTA